jgi:hypothetical protein
VRVASRTRVGVEGSSLAAACCAVWSGAVAPRCDPPPRPAVGARVRTAQVLPCVATRARGRAGRSSSQSRSRGRLLNVKSEGCTAARAEVRSASLLRAGTVGQSRSEELT